MPMPLFCGISLVPMGAGRAADVDMILVTGGAGFIGAHFVLDWLAEVGEPLVNLDALTYAAQPQHLEPVADDPRYRFIHGDVGDSAIVAALLQTHRPRAVIHLAAQTHVDRSIRDPVPFMQANAVQTSQLLDAVCHYWQDLPADERARFRFLLVSTDEVYGSLGPDDAPFTEQHRCEPNSPYAASKAAAEHAVRAAHRTYGLPVLTTRSSNNYGPFQFPEKLIPLALSRALAGEPIPVYGDGQQVRDWMHVRDHCHALRRVLEAGVVGEIYNIGAGCERRNLDVVQQLCSHLDALRPRANGRPYADLIRFVDDRPGHDRRYALDTTRIRALGWRPLQTFETGLLQTAQWTLATHHAA